MKTFAFVVMVFSWASGQEQVTSDSLDGFQEAVETLFEGEDPGEEETGATDRLIYLNEHPIDLNSADFKELQQIPGISPLTAYRIFSARSVKKFSNVGELLSVDGFDEALFRRIIPFVTVPSRLSVLPLVFQVRSRIQSDLHNRRGYRNGDYAGGKEKLYSRVSFTAPLSETIGLQGNLTSEKDPGEMLNDVFLSGYLSARFRTFSVTAGDFVVSSGNDHVFARGARLGRRKGGGTTPAISGYHSTDEQRFFRGAAIAVDILGMSLGAFYSNKAVHGAFQNDGSLSSYPSGLFRTMAEQSKKNVTRERVVGGYVSVAYLSGLSVGLTGYDARFLAGRPPLQSIGLDVGWKGRRGWFSAGATREKTGGRSLFGSGEIEPLDGWSFFVANETFTGGFSSPYALTRTPVRESISVAGLQVRLHRGSRVSASAYAKNFPEGKQGGIFSEYEHGASLESVFSVSPDFQIDLRFVTRRSPDRIESLDSLGRAKSLHATQEVRKFRISVAAGRRTATTWISRIELIKANAPDEAERSGIMMSQELRYVPAKNLRIQAKVTLFAIDAYDARAFSFEPAVPGVVVNRMLLGEGTNSVLNVLYRVLSGIEISGSFSTEVKDGQQVIGSGLDEIHGDTYNRFTLQIDVRL
ncbi:MAG: helix-hairpin-helix domain-containing protein [Bacteroidota bacterium]